MLGHLLGRAGIDSIIIENRTREHVIDRVRAGVLEQGTVDLLRDSGVGERLMREGMRHDGIYIAFAGRRHRIDMAALTGGRGITIYGQNEVVKDLLAAHDATGRPLLFEVDNVTLHDLDSRRPEIRLHARRRVAPDPMRFRRRMRRVSRCLPALDSRTRGCGTSSARILSAGLAFSPTPHRLPTNWFTLSTIADSRFSACARRMLPVSTCSVPQTKMPRRGPRTGSGRNSGRGYRPTTGGRRPRASLLRRA